MNKYSYLFVLPMIDKLQEKYSFNREINDKRIRREKILLPLNKNNSPDWEFMEKYMRILEQEKTLEYLKSYSQK